MSTHNMQLHDKLEIVFVRHYAPNCMLASEDNTR